MPVQARLDASEVEHDTQLQLLHDSERRWVNAQHGIRAFGQAAQADMSPFRLGNQLAEVSMMRTYRLPQPLKVLAQRSKFTEWRLQYPKVFSPTLFSTAAPKFPFEACEFWDQPGSDRDLFVMLANTCYPKARVVAEWVCAPQHR